MSVLQWCSLASVCDNEPSASRRKRAIDEGPSGQASFTVAAADTVFVNNPPVVTSPNTVDMFEDDGIRYKINQENIKIAAFHQIFRCLPTSWYCILILWDIFIQ